MSNVSIGHIAARWYMAHLCHYLLGLSGVGDDKPHPAIGYTGQNEHSFR